MPAEEGVRTVREAVGIFSSPEALQDAIDELLSSGFHRAELSLLASEHAVEKKLRHQYEKVGLFQDESTIPEQPTYQRRRLETRKADLLAG